LQYELPETETVLSESPASQPTVELSAAVPVKSTPKPVPAKQEKQVSANDAEVMPASGHLDIRQDSIVGSEYRFRIYQVQRGEKLVSLARSAGTTVSAIAAVNYNFSTPFKEDQIIVIPIDQNDVSRLPSFETYRVSETIGVAELAERLHVDIDQFHLYNGIKKGNTLAEGEWVLIPHGKHK
jgi:LysM repeat protein